MSDYRVVPADNARAIRLGPTGLLVQGEVLHFDDRRERFNAKAIRERHGRRLRSRIDESGKGRYWWTEPLEER